MKCNVKRQIRKDCRNYMKQVIVAGFFADLLAIAMPTINAHMIGNMTDYLIAWNVPEILQTLPQFLCAVLVTILAQPLFNMWKYIQLAKNSFEYDVYIINRFMHKPLREIQKEDYGTVMERLEGDLGDFCWNTILLYSRLPVILCYAAVIGWTMFRSKSDAMFNFVLIVLPSLPVLKAQLIGKKKAVFRREFAEYNEKRRSMEADIISSMDFLWNCGIEELVGRLLQKNYQQYMKESGKRKRAFDSRNVMLDFLLEQGIPLCVLMVGSVLVYRNSLTIGTLLGGYLMLPAIGKCYTYGAGFVEEVRGAQEYFDRISMFYGEQEKKADTPVDEINMLCVEGISFAYGEGLEPVMDNFSMSVEVGECVRISGSNGCGKSTLLSLLGGLYEPDRGTVRNQSGRILFLQQLRSVVSFQEQNGAIFSGTMFDNLFIQEEKRWEAVELLNVFGLDKTLSHQLEPGGANLSPGEKKKLLLIRTLLKPAQFYILDEPMNHLDQKGRQALNAQILKRESAFIIVSHQDFLPYSNKERRITINRKERM